MSTSTWVILAIFVWPFISYISDYIAKEDERKAGTRGTYDFSPPKNRSSFF